MKIVQVTQDGERRERLLHGYFFNAFLIATLKQAVRKGGRIRTAAAARPLDCEAKV